MQKLHWRQLEIFHAIMTSSNLTQAARLLHTSQPTISRELARLEQQLQVPLFSRYQGRLHPTRQALQLFEEVQRSWHGLQRIQETAESLGNFQHSTLSITCLPTFSQSLLPVLCQSFLERYHQLNISIISQEPPLLEEWMTAQRYDLGLTETAYTPAATERIPLMTVNEVCVLPQHHPLAQQSILTPADFEDQPFISLAKADNYRILLDDIFTSQQIRRILKVETQTAASVCSMVKAGIGISIINPLTALDWIDRGVVIRRFSIQVPFTVSLLRPLHRPASAVTEAFIDHLLQKIPLFQQQIADAL